MVNEDDDSMVNRQATSSAMRLAMTEHCRYILHDMTRVQGAGITYLHTTLPNERSTPPDLTHSCERGGGCGGVRACHAPTAAARVRRAFYDQ